MGNVESTNGFKRQLSGSRIEIVMADIDCEDNDMDKRLVSGNCKRQLLLSHNSLSSMTSITSATQTDPELFTQWPKKRFMFQWLTKLRNYHRLLSRSQQFLNSNMLVNWKNDEVPRSMEVKLISLSTQTVNQIPDNCLFSNKLKSNSKPLPMLIKPENEEKPLEKTEEKISEEIKEKPNEREEPICSNSAKSSDNEIDNLESGPIFKKPKLQMNPVKMTNGRLISQLSNKFYQNEINKCPVSYNDLQKSMDSLTSVTQLSKPDNKSLIFKSKNSSINYGPNRRAVKIGQKVLDNKWHYNDDKISFENNNPCRGFNKKRKRNRAQRNGKVLTKIKSSYLVNNVQSNPTKEAVSSKASIFSESGKVQILSYKFWVAASGKNWEIFHNPGDRRIESIGRIAKCRIQLTHLITRHSDGLLKQQVIIYAPNQSCLEKCCKLFDDKFPDFYATSGLIRILYFRKGSVLGNLLDNKNVLQIDIPMSNNCNVSQQRNRKRNSSIKMKQFPELGFLRNEMVKD